MRYSVDYQILTRGLPVAADIVIWGGDGEITARDRITNVKTTYKTLGDLYRAYPGSKLTHPTRVRIRLGAKPKKTSLISSDRELQVAELVNRDYTNRHIATVLGVGITTVEKHVQNLIKKLGLSSRVGIALWYERNVKNAHRKNQ